MSKKTVALLASVLLTALIAGFATRGEAATAKGDDTKEIDTLTWGLTSGPRSLDLAHSMDINTISVLSLGMESLLRIDAKGHLVPNLAVSYTHPNLLTYVFNLRKGV